MLFLWVCIQTSQTSRTFIKRGFFYSSCYFSLLYRRMACFFCRLLTCSFYFCDMFRIVSYHELYTVARLTASCKTSVHVLRSSLVLDFLDETAQFLSTRTRFCEQKDHKPDSWMTLLKGMRATLVEKKFKQIPQLSTSKQLDIGESFSFSGVSAPCILFDFGFGSKFFEHVCTCLS